MKTRNLFFGLLTAVALAGCSSDDNVASTDDAMISDGTPRYLNVSIASAPSSSDTRTEVQGDPNNAVYEYGTSDENAVSLVRFYFFTDDGTATAIKADGHNYFDWSNVTSSNVEGINIEKTLDAQIVISTKAGDRIPSKILAVVNPDVTVLGSANRSLSEVRNLISDFAKTATAGRFVMTNSVYRDAGYQLVSATPITSANLKTSENEAKQNPVVMYVERNVAKVSLQFDEDAAVETTEDGVTYVPLIDKNGNNITGENGQQIYLQVGGWNLTATTNCAYLSKHINTSWKVDLFDADMPWNYYPYYRSYWATNVGTDDKGSDLSGKDYIAYNAIGTTAIKSSNVIYTNENAAAKYDTGEQRSHPTQAIIAGKLVYKDESGNVTPINMGEFGGSVVYSEEDLISTMVAQLQTSLYKKTTVTGDGGTVYKSISADDVKLIPAEDRDASISNEEKTGRYYVELALSNENTTWYKYNADDNEFEEYTPEEVTEILHSIHGKMWEAGMTYYYFKINHLASDGVGKYGVVRNHSYKITINGIIGTGTPVYDNTKIIYPETPNEEDTWIAAQVNVLTWRVVPSTVTLGE